eukprot:TRINITY_DN18283_c0_g1_i4.p1 TRINITY_DN18283_c0_g1~~TRINITY_DN18283_c0_g1_i4.p1  ORF type:complete len:562 (-),score=125.66 TRINITY_DN18283_c0_g1_i4:44-1681(-)
MGYPEQEGGPPVYPPTQPYGHPYDPHAGVYGAPPPHQQQGYYPPPTAPPPHGAYPPPQHAYSPPPAHYDQGAYPPQPMYVAAPPVVVYAAPLPPPVMQMTPEQMQHMFPQKPKYQDLPWAILFILHLVSIIVLLAISYNKTTPSTDSDEINRGKDSGNNFSTETFFLELGRFLGVILAASGAAIIFSFIYLSLTKRHPKAVIKATLVLSILVWIALAIISFLTGSYIMGIIMIVIALLNALVFWMWRKRIPFAAAILSSVCKVLLRFPAPSYFSYLSGLVLLGWTVLWLITVSQCQKYTGYASGILTAYLFLSFFWTTQVVKNVVHVCTSGLMASYYFYSGSPNGMPGNPTLGALKRACTTSFGSICLGSLIVAVIKTLRQLVQNARNNNKGGVVGAVLACIAICILSILERLVEYFNMYAFTQVAIYGKSFCQASKDTWNLFKSNGADAIINDNLISGVLVVGTILGGCFAAVVGAVVAHFLIPQSWVLLAIVSFLVGACLVTLAMEVIESAVATMLVCFVLEPAVLANNNPELFTRLRDKYNR